MNGNVKGFSLLEVMLVMALLGGIATLAIAALPGDRKPQQAAAHLNSQLQWAAERATVEGQAYGLAVASREWQWLRLVRAGSDTPPDARWPGYVWQRAGGSLTAPASGLPDPARLQLMLEGEEQPLAATLAGDSLQPQILLLPGGESSSFVLHLLSEGEAARTIALEPLG